MTKHARHSPSKLAALERCPCFDSNTDMRKARDTEAADEGILIHEAVEKENPALLETEEQLYTYHACLKRTQEIIDSCAGPVEIRKEAKSTVRGLTFGTADHVIIDRGAKTLHISDYKTGRVPVEHAQTNLQTMAYGVGLLERFPSMQYLETHIIAPRVPDFTDARFDRSIIDSVRGRIEQIILSVADPFKQPCGGPQCEYCTNKPRCPVMNAAAQDVVRGAGLLPLPDKFLPEQIISPEDRAKSMLLARLLPDWCTLVKQLNTTAVLEYGEEIPGFSLRRRAGNARIVNETDVLAFTRGTLGLTDREMLDAGLAKLSLSKLAQYLLDENRIAGLDTKKDVMDVLFKQLGDSVEQGEEVVYLQKDRKPTDEELVRQLSQNNGAAK